MSESEIQIHSVGDVSRRQVLRSIALAVTVIGAKGVTLEAGRFVHSLAEEAKNKEGSYLPKFFSDHEFKSVSCLADLIIPADEVSSSAKEVGAPEFIDLLCSQNKELAHIFTGGILWLDQTIEKVSGHSFIASSSTEQHRIMKLLAEEAREQEKKEHKVRNAKFNVAARNHGYLSYSATLPSSLGPGGNFFVWVRRLTVDAFYTSPVGIQDIGYQGNGYRESYRVPQKAIDYALKRSPFKS